MLKLNFNLDYGSLVSITYKIAKKGQLANTIQGICMLILHTVKLYPNFLRNQAYIWFKNHTMWMENLTHNLILWFEDLHT